MPDDPSALRDEVAALRAASARLRAVVEARDTEITALRAALEAGQARQAEVIRRVVLRVAELDRRLGMDSSRFFLPAVEGAAGGKGAPEGGAAGGAAGAAARAQARWAAGPPGGRAGTGA